MSHATLAELLNCLPQRGQVKWIGVRPARRAIMDVVSRVTASPGEGLLGDRYAGRSGTRQVTLVQAEHLQVIASILRVSEITFDMMRRNIAVERINLLSLKNQKFKIGDATLEYTGLCYPCSFMEEVFGQGGYNAMRGHGGITARVIEGGEIALGEAVYLAESEDQNQ